MHKLKLLPSFSVLIYPQTHSLTHSVAPVIWSNKEELGVYTDASVVLQCNLEVNVREKERQIVYLVGHFNHFGC